ncbi:hypothetical protein B0H14DRAFT_3756332 [Mycena olivaceomarginata]|nr:hypothetical protein B0H14DRAFT_3756332 [Mycena olivaceomarginata]
MSRSHKGVSVPATLVDNLESLGVASAYPPDPTDLEPRTPYAGLPVTKNQYGCPVCPLTGNQKYVKGHMKTHPQPCGPMVKALGTQVLNRGGGQSAHRIRVTTEEEEEEEGGSSEHSGGEHEVELRSLVAMPKDDELPWLHELVYDYFSMATGLIESTDELVLQTLNSTDPEKNGINNTPLHDHHQKEQTLAQYIVPITHLVAALLRESEHYEFPSSEALSEALEGLKHEHSSETDLHAVFLALWQAQWRTSRSVKQPDPTMAFLCLYSLKLGGEFNAAKETTPVIRRLCRAIQLSALVEIHALVDSGECVDQMEAMDCVGCFTREKELTTFSSLMSLQHYATSLTLCGMSMPQIWWLDRDNWSKLVYKGQEIALDHMRQIVWKLEDHITDVWENKVLLGLGLHVKYGNIVNNMVNKTSGYSFLDDPRNPFADHKDTLITQILADPALRKKFVIRIPGTDREELNVMACREWVGDLADVEASMGLYEEYTGGGTLRGTELGSLLARNTDFRYDKTSNTVQADRLIPIAFSAFAADLIVQIHTFARPLARFFAKLIWPNRPEVSALYGQMLFMDNGKELTTDRISNLMVAGSCGILSWRMTIQPHRHINIAFRRKLCRVETETLEGENDDTNDVHAVQSGHSGVTEDRVYDLSMDALAGIPEHVLYLFLDASTGWQKVLLIVPGGLGRPYTKSRYTMFGRLKAKGIIKPSPQSTEQKGLQHIEALLTRLLEKQFESTEMCERIEAKTDQLEGDVLGFEDLVRSKGHLVFFKEEFLLKKTRSFGATAKAQR